MTPPEGETRVSNYDRLFSCSGKIALVTGGAGLLGTEVVSGLAAAGAAVWSADITSTLPAGASGSIVMDIASPDSVSSALARLADEAGGVDILVNCAYPRSAGWGTDVDALPIGSFSEDLTNHLGGYFLVSRDAAERMAASGGGSIVNFASIYGLVGPSWEVYEGTEMTMPVAYSAIKGGVIAMTRFLATRYGRRGVRANVVSPGGVFDGQDAGFVERYSSLTPLGKMAEPRDVVGAAVFLASDASSYVTGTNIVVDGGWTAR